MKTKLHVKLNRRKSAAYPILIEKGLVARASSSIMDAFPKSNFVIITDTTVKKLYGENLKKTLQTHGCTVHLLSILPGEQSKTQKSKTLLEETMLKRGIGRDAVIIAIGGGVVGDLAGFVAATYMRGIPYVQIPTTLLSMVDSSVGGKTGINTHLGKNTIGAFWQPEMILIDPEVLKSLPKNEIVYGLVEAIKMFITSDTTSFHFAEKNIQKAIGKNVAVLTEMIVRALRIKTKIVGIDELESGQRTVLNFGHTIGHALEKSSGYTLPHGHAVALGILVESALNGKDQERIQSLITNELGIHPKELRQFSLKKLIGNTKNDKKNKNGKTQYVLIDKIGKAKIQGKKFAHSVTDTEVEQVIKKLTQ